MPAHGVDPDRLTTVELQLARLEERTVPSCTRAQILCRLRTRQGAVGGAFRVVAVGSPVTLSIDVGSEQPAEGGLDVRGAVFNDTATAATAVGRGIHTGKGVEEERRPDSGRGVEDTFLRLAVNSVNGALGEG